MKYGICGEMKDSSIVKEAGFDYLEMTVGGLLRPLEDESCFAEKSKELRASALPVPVVNCFVPGDMKICGPEVDEGALTRFAVTVARRASEAGVEIIVFGSGGARRVPDGYSRDAAWNQLVRFAEIAGTAGLAHGVTVVVEPLNLKECNVLNTVAECARLVRAVDHPGFRLLVDGYHWMTDDNDVEALKAAMDLIEHVHVATFPNRKFPGMEPCALDAFLSLLVEEGYEGRISIEGNGERTLPSLTAALETMKAPCRFAAMTGDGTRETSELRQNNL